MGFLPKKPAQFMPDKEQVRRGGVRVKLASLEMMVAEVSATTETLTGQVNALEDGVFQKTPTGG